VSCLSPQVLQKSVG
jgi:hypothetical protein